MKTIILKSILYSFIAIVFFACDIKKNKEVIPTENFFKVFESEQFTRAYIPLDVKQTSDGGFLILGATRTENSDFYGVYVMKADSLGFFKYEQILDPATVVNPLNQLMQIGNEFYFFCMNGISLEAKLMQVSQAGEVNEVTQLGGVVYPLHSSVDGNGFLLQNYNRFEKKTYLLKVNTAGQITAAKGYTIGFGDFDVEEPIVKHLIGTGNYLPFSTGSLGNGLYYFNGFYNFTFSMVFVDFNAADDVVPGVLQGFRDERGISAALNLGGNNFALARFGFGQNFLIPKTTLSSQAGAIASSSDLMGNYIPELRPNSRIILKKIQTSNQSFLMYGSDTRSGQIVLYAFDEATGNLLGSKYLGFSTPFEIGGFSTTADGGLVVCGTTYIAGRFPRICIFKLSKNELEGILMKF